VETSFSSVQKFAFTTQFSFLEIFSTFNFSYGWSELEVGAF
jgi:hypothetical protein